MGKHKYMDLKFWQENTYTTFTVVFQRNIYRFPYQNVGTFQLFIFRTLTCLTL